jgi:hypothetical protein
VWFLDSDQCIQTVSGIVTLPLKPDTESAAVSAEGPGSGDTGTFCTAQAATSSAPGSDIPGVPARSEVTNEMKSEVTREAKSVEKVWYNLDVRCSERSLPASLTTAMTFPSRAKSKICGIFSR